MKKRCHQQSQNCTLDGTRSSRSDALSFYRKVETFVLSPNRTILRHFVVSIRWFPELYVFVFPSHADQKIRRSLKSAKTKANIWGKCFLGWWLFLGVPIRAEVHDNNQIFPEFILYYKRLQAWWNTPGLESGKIRIKLWWIWLMPGSAWKDNHFLKGFPVFRLSHWN